MEISASFFLVLGFIAVICAVPQFIRLIKKKKTSQFSLTTWIAWLLYQTSSLIYSIYLANLPYVIINILWVTFYAGMVVLIIKYKSKGSRREGPRA